MFGKDWLIVWPVRLAKIINFNNEKTRFVSITLLPCSFGVCIVHGGWEWSTDKVAIHNSTYMAVHYNQVITSRVVAATSLESCRTHLHAYPNDLCYKLYCQLFWHNQNEAMNSVQELLLFYVTWWQCTRAVVVLCHMVVGVSRDFEYVHY